MKTITQIGLVGALGLVMAAGGREVLKSIDHDTAWKIAKGTASQTHDGNLVVSPEEFLRIYDAAGIPTPTSGKRNARELTTSQLNYATQNMQTAYAAQAKNKIYF